MASATTPTQPTNGNGGPFSQRHYVGSRKRARNKRGRIRGIVVKPEEMLDLIRDTYANAPVPSDAQFYALGIDTTENYIQFFYYSLISPNVNCIKLKPELLLDLLKSQSHGIIPKDGELDSICVHTHFTIIRLDVYSNHFPALNVSEFPLIQLRYSGGSLLIGNPSDHGTDYEKLPPEVR